MTHARRVMDKPELDSISKLHEEFKAAIDGTEGKELPEDARPDSVSSSMNNTAKMGQVRSALKNVFGKNKGARGS